MNAVCVGGPINGEVVEDVLAMRVIVPVQTREFSIAHSRWFDTYGLAWELENMDHILEHPSTPPPPPWPEAVYLLRCPEIGPPCYVFQGLK